MAVPEVIQPVRPEDALPLVKKSAPTWTNGVNKASRSVAWYQRELNRVPATALQVFREYSKLKDEEIIEHIHVVRDRAWEIMPYPCIGLFRFLDFPAYLSPVYPTILERVRNGATYLDLGCCFGQDIRKLVLDGASGANLIGVDTESRFLELGYELFGDRDSLQAHLYTGDVFDENFLAEWRDKVDIIFLGSFLHLFSFEQQIVIVRQLCRLLKKAEGSMVFGRHMAMERGGTLKTNAAGWSLYHHSPQTIRELWDHAPEGEWDVTSELKPYASEGWDNGVKWQGNGDEVKQMYFSATRL